MYIYIFMYICISIYMYIYKYIYIYTYVYIYICIYEYMSVHIYIYIYMDRVFARANKRVSEEKKARKVLPVPPKTKQSRRHCRIVYGDSAELCTNSSIMDHSTISSGLLDIVGQYANSTIENEREIRG